MPVTTQSFATTPNSSLFSPGTPTLGGFTPGSNFGGGFGGGGSSGGFSGYGPKTPSWDQIRRTMPYSMQSPFGARGFNPVVAAPEGDSQIPSAFNGQGYDSTSAFINDLVAQIAGGGGTPTTTGWFDLPQRPLNLFGSSY